ncbi:MAG: CRISPR-associated endonuclease Cas2 [Phycisphaerales bacterium]|nr:CRISPR-associated endonuclease Cas2 [Phycisphaerales bacterium]
MLRDYLVMYDIRDPKRLTRVFKTMKGFGRHLQYSVFRCEMPEVDLIRMKIKLAEIVDHRKDQILMFDLGPMSNQEERLVDYLGVAPSKADTAAVVV